MNAWVIYVRSSTLESDKEIIHSWEEKIQRQNLRKKNKQQKPNNQQPQKNQNHI